MTTMSNAPVSRMRRALLGGSLLSAGLGNFAAQAEALPAANPLSGFELLDANGRPFHTRSLAGKTVLINLIFTGCSSTCSTTTTELVPLHQRIQQGRGKDQAAPSLVMVTVSVDPLSDTPQALKQFAAARGVSFDGWHWLTGQPTEVARFVNTVVGPEMGQKEPAQHLSSLQLFSPTGMRMARFRGVGINVEQVLRESMRVDRFARKLG